MKIPTHTVRSVIALLILRPVLSAPATSVALARDIPEDSQSSDWIPASVISHDFTSTGGSDNEARALLEGRNSQGSLALTSLGGCLQSSVSGWPKTRPSHEQFKKCLQSATGSVAKRGQPSSISASPLVADGDTGSGICSVANTVLSNFLTGKDMEDLADSICNTMVTLGVGIITKDAGAIASAITVQGGHKKGLSIVHKHRNLQIIATVANVAGITAKSKLVDLCVQAIRYQAETCVTDLKYGAFNSQIDHVAKPSTTTWRDGKGAVQAIFDIGFAMPDVFR